MSIIVLDPAQEPVAQTASSYPMAPRLATLDGKRLGLYSNVKLNSARLLDFVADELAKEFSFDILRGFYDAAQLMPDDGWGEIDTCDAVLLANGDCGACSSSGIANAIELEKRGIPTLLVSTTPFFPVVKTMSELRGMPQIKWAVVDHPIGSLKDEELRKRAASAAQQFRELILQSAVRSAAE
jgi:hypothetical protein